MTNTKIRGFEIVTDYQDSKINLPQRSTYNAAGYDLEAAETITLPSYWKQLFKYLAVSSRQWIRQPEESTRAVNVETLLKSTLVPTGIKAYMQDDEYLQVINRSSNPLKRFLMLPNSIGIIDQDYYDNDANEGHIYVQLINYGLFDYTIKKGDRIAQGIFSKYYKVDYDQGGLAKRQGGFGSSDRFVSNKEEA